MHSGARLGLAVTYVIEFFGWVGALVGAWLFFLLVPLPFGGADLWELATSSNHGVPMVFLLASGFTACVSPGIIALTLARLYRVKWRQKRSAGAEERS